jgi:MYXO-CTERM domain-containing protein
MKLGGLALLVAAVSAGGAVGCLLAEDDSGDDSGSDLSSNEGVKGLQSTIFLTDVGCTATKVGPKALLLAARCLTGTTTITAGATLKYAKTSAKTKVVQPGTPTPPTASTAPVDTTGMTTGQKTFTTELYPAVQPTCGSCHLSGSGGAPIYFGADVLSSYPLFKSQGYDLATSIYTNKGRHEGPAMTAAQLTAAADWQAAEANEFQDNEGFEDQTVDNGVAVPEAGPPVLAKPDASTPNNSPTVVKIHSVQINPSFTKACPDATTCAFDTAAEAKASDVAVIVLESELTGVPAIPVDLDPVSDGDPVIALGSGCSTFDGTAAATTTFTTNAVGQKSAGHDGSPFKGDAAGLKQLASSYVITPGFGWKKGEPKICNTDIGAPLLRADKAVVVGVTANYTLFKPAQVVPVTIEHTRVDKASAVGTWLTGLKAGITTTNSCDGSCTHHPFDAGVPVVNGGSTSGTSTSGNSTSGHSTSGNTTSGNTTSGNTTSGNTTSGNTTSGNTTSGNTTSGNTTSGNTTSGNTTSGNTTSGNTTSGKDKGGSSNTSGSTTPPPDPADPFSGATPQGSGGGGNQSTSGDDPNAGGGGDDDGGADGGTKKAAKKKSGCSAAPGETSGGGSSMLLGLGVALVLARRRRSR